MKTLKIAGIVVIVLAALLLIFVMFQPSQAHVEKSIVINGSAAAINDEIGRFQNFDAWSPWSKISPEVKYSIVTFEGFTGTFCSEIKLEAEGSGTKVTWIYDGLNDGLKGKMMWVLMRGRMEDQYDIGLAALKKLIESRPVTADPAVTPSDSTATK